MASPYARSRSGGGSAYAQDRSSRGSAYSTPREPSAPASEKGHGGILGGIENVAHVVGQKAELAGRDIKGIPGGIVQVGTLLGEGTKAALTGDQKALDKNSKQIKALGRSQVEQASTALHHPLRDPFLTVTTLAPFLHGAARIGTGTAEAGRALKAGEGIKGAVKAARAKPELEPRVLKSGAKEVPLIPSRNAAVRIGQKAYDKTLQRAIDKKPEGKIAAHAQKRIGGALDEEARTQQKMRAVPASLLDKAAGKLSKTPAARREEQAALELTSVNTSPEDASAYHAAQADKGVNPEQNRAVSKLYKRVADRGLLTKNESGDVVVNAADHPKLAKVDARLSTVQAEGDKILVEKDVRDAGALKTRRDAPAQIRAGAKYEKPTPGKLGVESDALIAARARAERIGKEVDAAEVRQPLDNLMPNYLGGKGDSRAVAGLRGAHARAKEDAQRLEDAAANRVKPTGIVGGETARPGRGFVSARVSEKKLGKAEASASRGPVVGVAKEPIDSKSFTGRSIEQGLVPKHVTGAASQHFRQIVKFVNTDARRRAALETGSDVRRSKRDVLVRNPDVSAEKLSGTIQQALGRETSNVDTAEELATQEGLRAAHQAFVEHLIPDIKSRFANDRGQAIGVKAPEGYKWVDRNALGDLTKPPAGPRGKIASTIDTVNSAITAATVYFKVGHVGTRVLTNAVTNIVQSSAAPRQTAKSVKLWHALSEEDQARALAAAGQHGFSSLPHEGVNLVAVAAGKGAQWWAKHADAAFRFNSLSYELRKAGYDTPDKFRQALDHVESGGQGMSGSEWAKLSAATRRADREAISYDRLNDFEKRYLTRAIWFYPWIKGSTMFTVRTAIEHPYKTGLLGAAGVSGREAQERQLGPTPSYEAGLVKLFGGDSNPAVADLSTFSPFATSADVLESPVQPGALAGFLNPAAGAAGQFTYGLNQYGGPSQQPYLDALLAIGAATPEQQLAESYAAQGQDQSGRMFQKTPLSTIARYLVGPALPRKVNRGALAKAAAREKSDQR